MKLRYKAVSKDGKVVRGTIEANEPAEAAAYLRQRHLTPITIKNEKEKDLSRFLPGSRKVKTKDLVLFTRQLSSMLASGLTLIKALEILKAQTQNKLIQETLGAILLDLEEGSSFANSLSKYPDIFPPIYVSLVKAGESSGLLDKIFLRLANNLEKQMKLKGKVKSALMYPAIVITLMVVVMAIMIMMVIPQLTQLYASLDAELPTPTKIVIALSDILKNFLPIVIGVLVIAFYAFLRWRRTPKGRYTYDKTILKMPLIGKLMKQTILAEFSRTFGLLIGTGTLIVDSLKQSLEVTGNKVFERDLEEISKRVEKGVPVGEALSLYPLFPPILVQLVKVGEETGKMDENLMKASEYFEEEVDQSVKNLTTAMEPFIMIVLGVGVGFLVFSVITPIYGLLSNVQ
jgi:type IV pilus assembly protein PilC